MNANLPRCWFTPGPIIMASEVVLKQAFVLLKVVTLLTSVGDSLTKWNGSVLCVEHSTVCVVWRSGRIDAGKPLRKRAKNNKINNIQNQFVT